MKLIIWDDSPLAATLPQQQAEVKITAMKNMAILILSDDGCTHCKNLIENVVQNNFT